jgi:hypothetical protein
MSILLCIIEEYTFEVIQNDKLTMWMESQTFEVDEN